MPRTGARLAEDTTLLFLSVILRIANDTVSISFSTISEADKSLREDVSGGVNGSNGTDRVGPDDIGPIIFSPFDNN
ncbi:hypothetical protein [Endozoicomonas sp. ALC013]|uniref:hypothetical protein n=1 Tax=Endozoicomonas sp. ALC013 TaxID=3403076 RepID=UPI003BB704E3